LFQLQQQGEQQVKVTVSHPDLSLQKLNTQRSVPQHKDVVKTVGFGNSLNSFGVTWSSLLELKVSAIGFNECRRDWGSDDLFDNTMMCAANLNETTWTPIQDCQGNIGGPLYTQDGSNLQVGITSFGEGCARHMPTVYTRVSGFVEWIEQSICELSDYPPVYKCPAKTNSSNPATIAASVVCGLLVFVLISSCVFKTIRKIKRRSNSPYQRELSTKHIPLNANYKDDTVPDGTFA
jgi:secreted trypsin-like serine protease